MLHIFRDEGSILVLHSDSDIEDWTANCCNSTYNKKAVTTLYRLTLNIWSLNYLYMYN